MSNMLGLSATPVSWVPKNRLRGAPFNVHKSHTMYDPDSRDLNESREVTRIEKQQEIIALVKRYFRQIVVLINIKTKQIVPAYFGPIGPGSGMRSPEKCIMARTWAENMLFGHWRAATQEEIDSHALELQVQNDKYARLEARRHAVKAGLISKEMAMTADAIMKLNRRMDKEELTKELTPPDDAELDMIAKLAQEAKKKSSAPVPVAPPQPEQVEAAPIKNQKTK